MSPPVCAHALEPEMRLMAADMPVGSFPDGVPPQVPGTLEPCRSASIWAAQCALRSETHPHPPQFRQSAAVTSTAASAGTCGGAILAAFCRKVSSSGAGWLGLAG